MKKIAVLIDFTPTCVKATEFAGKIAQKANASVVLIHVAPNSEKGNEAALMQKMDVYAQAVPAGIICEKHIDFGTFFSQIPYALKAVHADLAVVGTHGVVGIMQNLFGSNIMKLIKALSVPSLVVQDNSVYTDQTFNDILFPIAPHEDFEVKYKQTTTIAKLFNSTVHIIAVRKNFVDLAPQLEVNLKKTVDYFEANGVQFKEVREDANDASIGYANQILGYSKNNNIGTIAIMSKVSKDNYYFGVMDKENLLLNKAALPILCTNEVSL